MFSILFVIIYSFLLTQNGPRYGGHNPPEAKETLKDESKPDKPGTSSAPPSPKDPPQKDEPAGASIHGDSDRDELLKCLKDAVRITEQVDSARFSTQDIIKLALTLFIHRTS